MTVVTVTERWHAALVCTSHLRTDCSSRGDA